VTFTKEAIVRGLHWTVIALCLACAGTTGPALGQTFSSGSTGTDGALTPTANTTLVVPDHGVFNFTTVTIPSGITVRFARGNGNAPVMLLASGNVTIAGTIDVSGTSGGNAASGTLLGSNAGLGGPGGFDGGNGSNGIASTVGGTGLGPGGGGPGTGAGFATTGAVVSATGTPGTPYGNEELLPLIGGSGGGGGGAGLGSTSAGGGGGGGAIVIASSATLTLTGAINARGGNGGSGNNPGGGGSGGAIRLVASTITGANGALDVRGGLGGSGIGIGAGAGSAGRLRIEAHTNTASLNVNTVAPSVAAPSAVALGNAPALAITSIGGVPTPPAPAGSFSTPDVTLPATVANPVSVTLAAANIPPGTPVVVTVKGQTGGGAAATAMLTGTASSSNASTSITLPDNQPSVVMATATFALAAVGSGPLYADGEIVDRVRVSTVGGGVSETVWITQSGRELSAVLSH
jgi:hypothetical protein